MKFTHGGTNARSVASCSAARAAHVQPKARIFALSAANGQSHCLAYVGERPSRAGRITRSRFFFRADTSGSVTSRQTRRPGLSHRTGCPRQQVIHHACSAGVTLTGAAERVSDRNGRARSISSQRLTAAGREAQTSRRGGHAVAAHAAKNPPRAPPFNVACQIGGPLSRPPFPPAAPCHARPRRPAAPARAVRSLHARRARFPSALSTAPPCPAARPAPRRSQARSWPPVGACARRSAFAPAI